MVPLLWSDWFLCFEMLAMKLDFDCWLNGMSCNSIGENMIKVFPFTGLNILSQKKFIVEQERTLIFVSSLDQKLCKCY
jgi:hypothetical protein